MDKHICKAKRIDDGEWVTGFLITIPNEKGFIEQCYIVTKIDFRDSIYDVYKYAEEVDVNTICNCVGRKDINGNLMFQHDIIQDKNGNNHTIVYAFDCFCIPRSTKYDMVFDRIPRGCRVIGNKFDNTELMEN
jgi:hypothetical protein